MRPIAGRENRVTQAAVNFADKSDDLLLALLARGSGADRIARDGIRRVLRHRGHVFDKQTGAMLAHHSPGTPAPSLTTGRES